MEKRYQVFISSTFRDLEDERRQVIQALLELDCIPAGMELFPAADDTAWALIQRVIDDCDYYLVIVGGRYGSVDAEGISFTEREYDYAVERGIPVLGFVHADPSAIPAGKSEMSSEARQKLDLFRNKVQKKLSKEWRSPEELGGVISRSLIQTIKAKPAEGWVRARHASSAEELNVLRTKVDDLQKQLEDATTLPPQDAEGLAKGAKAFELRFHYEGGIYTGDYFITYTWDELFATVGPALFNEAPESGMKSQLRSRVAADMISRGRRLRGSSIALDQMASSQEVRIRINEEDFQTIKVQFRALGLIEKSIRKRAVSDTQTYWSLTRYGERYATVLKAIRAEEEHRPSPNGRRSARRSGVD